MNAHQRRVARRKARRFLARLAPWVIALAGAMARFEAAINAAVAAFAAWGRRGILSVIDATEDV